MLGWRIAHEKQARPGKARIYLRKCLQQQRLPFDSSSRPISRSEKHLNPFPTALEFPGVAVLRTEFIRGDAIMKRVDLVGGDGRTGSPGCASGG